MTIFNIVHIFSFWNIKKFVNYICTVTHTTIHIATYNNCVGITIRNQETSTTLTQYFFVLPESKALESPT